MANWQRHLDISEEFNKALDGEISASDFAEAVADKLSKLRPFPDDDQYLNDERDDLVGEFECLAADECSVEEIDGALARLYDWGDTSLDFQVIGGRKVCWVNTIGGRA